MEISQEKYTKTQYTPTHGEEKMVCERNMPTMYKKTKQNKCVVRLRPANAIGRMFAYRSSDPRSTQFVVRIDGTSFVPPQLIGQPQFLKVLSIKKPTESFTGQ